MVLILYGMLNLNFQPLLFCLYKININRLLVNANFEASCMHQSAGIDDCMHIVTLVLQISQTKENGSCMSANCCTKVLLCIHVTKHVINKENEIIARFLEFHESGDDKL